MKFILASASPRRKEILEKYGYSFDIIPSLEDEIVEKGVLPCYIATSLGTQKARSVYKIHKRPTLGADTIVVLDGEILGKPKDKKHAKEMLERLNNRAHQVITGFCFIVGGKEISGYDVSNVVFNDLSGETIDEYVKLGLGLDKAGGYGIQDEFNLVKSVEGSYYNIVGLPIEKIDIILKNHGFKP